MCAHWPLRERSSLPHPHPRRANRATGAGDRILAAKQRDGQADTSSLEREIDELVYALYGLTPEEIKLVEGTTK
jgi:adenine-specific DNA-methyltransferase